MDRFEAMRVFAKAAELGSLSGAARSLGMSLTSVSRLVSDLEARLSTQLLVRTTRRLGLTQEGRVFYERAKLILSELQDVENALSAGRNEPSGRLHVASPVLIGRMILAPLLPSFLAANPSVTIDLLLVDRVVNLVEEGIEVAIRVGRLPDSRLVARKLGEIRMVICGAPGYLDRRGIPQRPEDLSAHDCLVFSDALAPAEWRFASPDGLISVGVHGRLKANNLDALVTAALEGAGIVRVPFWQVATYLSAGRLRIALKDYEPPVASVHALFHPSKLLSTRVRAFIDHLAGRWMSDHLPTG